MKINQRALILAALAAMPMAGAFSPALRVQPAVCALESVHTNGQDSLDLLSWNPSRSDIHPLHPLTPLFVTDPNIYSLASCLQAIEFSKVQIGHVGKYRIVLKLETNRSPSNTNGLVITNSYILLMTLTLSSNARVLPNLPRHPKIPKRKSVLERKSLILTSKLPMLLPPSFPCGLSFAPE